MTFDFGRDFFVLKLEMRLGLRVVDLIKSPCVCESQGAHRFQLQHKTFSLGLKVSPPLPFFYLPLFFVQRSRVKEHKLGNC